MRIVSVNAYGVLDDITFPLLFKVYKPHTLLLPEDTYKTKPELAVEIIEELEQRGFQFDVVLADCVYGESYTFIQALEKRHLKYVLAIRSNHGAWLPKESRIRQLSWRPFDRIFSSGEKETRYIREIVFGWRRSVRFYLITVDPRTLPKDGTWFIMTNLEGKIEKTVGNTYGLRTWIEYGFKQIKNELGWADYRVTDYASIERWWELVFCAYTLVSWKSPHPADRRAGVRTTHSPSSTRGRAFPGASLVGYGAGLEERPQQLAADPSGVCPWVPALALDGSLRPPEPTHRVCATDPHHEPFSCPSPNLTEEG